MNNLNNTQMMLLQQHQKSAVVAVVFNILWFGLGSLYAKQWGDAFFGMVILFPFMALLCVAFPLIMLFVVAAAIISGIGSVKKYNIALLEGAVK